MWIEWYKNWFYQEPIDLKNIKFVSSPFQGWGCVGTRTCELCGWSISGTCLCIHLNACEKCGGRMLDGRGDYYTEWLESK